MSTWYKKLFGSKSLDTASLQRRLAELEDQIDDKFTDYETKFFDKEDTGAGAGEFNVAGVEMTISKALLQRLYTSEPWVYAAVNAVAETIAGLPWKLEKRTVVKKTVINEETGKEETIEQEVWTDASGAPLFKNFQYPNEFSTREEFLTFLVIDLLTAGDFLVYLDSDTDLAQVEASRVDDKPNSAFGRLRTQVAANSSIKGMYRLPPGMVTPVPKENGLGLEGYLMNTEEGQFVFDTAEVIHVKLPNPLDQWSGLPPLLAAIRATLLERFSSEHMIRFYKSGARLGGVIESEKELTKEQLSRFQRSFENGYTGRQNFHRTLVLPKGMKYNAVESNPVQGALIEFSKYNREAVLAAFRVPPVKVGILDHANYANANAQLKVFFTDNIIPRARMIEAGFNRKKALMPDNLSFRIRFDFSEIEVLQENYNEKAESGKKMLDAGMTVNEVRKKVWKLEPLDGGEQTPVIAGMAQPALPALPTMPEAPAATAPAEKPAEGATQVDAAQDAIAANQVTDPTLSLNGAQVTAMMNVVSQVAQGFLPRATGVEMIIVAFSVPRDAAERIMGKVGTSEFTPASDPGTQPAKPADTQIGIESGKSNDEDDDDPSDPDGSGSGSAPSDAGPESTSSAPSTDTKETTAAAPEAAMAVEPTYGFGMTKDTVVENWKGFLTKTDPLVLKRHGELEKFFKGMQSIVLNRLGANVKAYGLQKSRNEDDVNEILNDRAYGRLIDEYIAEADKALMEAYTYGYVDTLVGFKFEPRNEVALKRLRDYAASKVVGITDTTREQLRDVLVEAFDQGVAVNEVSSRIMDKFAEISRGRAVTIARTETLTAVSVGRDQKREDFKKEFPEAKMMKMWISAQDERVRDSHQELDGKSVGVDESFKEGLRFPRDPDCEDASEVINCRCTEITFAEDDQKLIEDTLPKKDEDESEEGEKQYNPEQPRAGNGQWTSDGGSADGSTVPVQVITGGGPSSVQDETPVQVGDRMSKPEPREVRSGPPQYDHDAEKRAEIMGGHKDTQTRYKGEDGKYVPARAAMHRQIVEDFVSRGDVSDTPEVIFLAGGSGSGKSTVMESFKTQLSAKYAEIDSDRVKASLPEYQALTKAKDPGAAALAHEESSDVAKMAIDAAIGQKRNVVYDSTFANPEKAKAMVEKFKRAGYKVSLVYADLPMDVAMQRAELRAKQTGRKVPRSEIERTHIGAPKSLGLLHGSFDNVTVYDNLGKTPKVTYRAVQGQVIVKDEQKLAEMQSRGHTLK